MCQSQVKNTVTHYTMLTPAVVDEQDNGYGDGEDIYECIPAAPAETRMPDHDHQLKEKGSKSKALCGE